MERAEQLQQKEENRHASEANSDRSKRSGTRDYSISTLLSLVALASILPLLLLGIIGLAQYVAQQRAAQIDQLTRYAATLTNAIDREIRGYFDIAEVIAASRFLQEGDLVAFGRLARDSATKARGHIVLIDRSGQQLVNTRTSSDIDLPVTEDIESLRRVVQTGKPITGDLFKGAISNLVLFVVRVPVFVNGDVRYVLSFEPDPEAIYKIVQQTFLPEGWMAAVLDGKGRMVARSRQHNELYGKPVSPEFRARLTGDAGLLDSRDFGGEEVLTRYQRSQTADWYVLMWAPKAVLDKPLHNSVLLAIALVSLTVVASIAAGFLAGRVVAEPVQQLLIAARALGQSKPVSFERTVMREANVVGQTLMEAARNIASREQALRKSELHTRFVMRELSHRSKNLLAVIQAIARQTSRSTTDVNEFNALLGERLSSLGKSQDLLVQQNWQGVSINDLIAVQLKAFIDAAEPRVSTSGPPVTVNAEAAQNIGMALHELATNASKHGALSVPKGHVFITWEWHEPQPGERHLRLRWSESGGPPVKPPERKGFGHAVVERLVAASLRGKATLDWRCEGVVWTLDVPESSLAERTLDPA